MFSTNWPEPEAHWLVMRWPAHLAPVVEGDRPGVEGADVEGGAGLRVEEERAAGVGGHGVEVAGAEIDGVAVAGRGDVVEVLGRHAGGGAGVGEGRGDHLADVAAADALHRGREHARRPGRRGCGRRRP